MCPNIFFQAKKYTAVPVCALDHNFFVRNQQRQHFKTYSAEGGSKLVNTFWNHEGFIMYVYRFTDRETDKEIDMSLSTSNVLFNFKLVHVNNREPTFIFQKIVNISVERTVLVWFFYNKLGGNQSLIQKKSSKM